MWSDFSARGRRRLENGGTDDPGGPLPPRRLESSTRLSEDVSLRWFPKKFLEGDLDGEGAEKLLGRASNVTGPEILVRETAQNAWDAKLPDTSQVSFQFHLRRATGDELRILRTQIFTGQSHELRVALPKLHAALNADKLWLLEVNDRGTKGLGGPTSSRVTPAVGEVTDFRDFVLNMGAPRDQEHGGGTYGFGKTASYRASRCGSLVIWSRFRTQHGEVGTRLIASAMGRSYDLDTRRYTGRHWWAVPEAGADAFGPLVDINASVIGQRLFRRELAPTETGTSLLIIDPDMEGLNPEEFAHALASRVLKHLWPKLHAEKGRPAMAITVLLEGEPVPIPQPDTHPVLRHFTMALDVVRKAERGDRGGVLKPHVIEGMPQGVGKAVIGHLALVPFPHQPEAEELFGVKTVSHLCLMRSSAELVVKYQVERTHPSESVSWAGVFKPLLRFDEAFADAEPPTHDDWTPDSLRNSTHKSVVRVALKRLSEAIRNWTTVTTGGVARSTQPAALLAEALSGLLPGAGGSAPKRATAASRSSGAAKKRAPAPAAVADRAFPQMPVDGVRTWLLHVALAAPQGYKYWVTPRPAIATADGDDDEDPRLSVVGWDEDGDPPSTDSDVQYPDATAWLTPEEALWLRVTTPEDYALSLTFDLEPFSEGDVS